VLSQTLHAIFDRVRPDTSDCAHPREERLSDCAISWFNLAWILIEELLDNISTADRLLFIQIPQCLWR
jgi:hypothetical protein